MKLGVEKLTMKRTCRRIAKVSNNIFIENGITLSTISTSFEKRFIILPFGISKNEIGALNTLSTHFEMDGD